MSEEKKSFTKFTDALQLVLRVVPINSAECGENTVRFQADFIGFDTLKMEPDHWQLPYELREGLGKIVVVCRVHNDMNSFSTTLETHT